MKIIRKLLLYFFSLKTNLIILSRIYLFLVKNGFLKNQYPELFYLKQLISNGNISIDIGANLGYYSFFLTKHAGNEGKVYAIEPIPLFREILKKNVSPRNQDNLVIYPYALGGENKTVNMGIPLEKGVLHHGKTRINADNKNEIIRNYEVEMKIPDELFSDLNRLDFIKCDVEGYETKVFHNFTQTIKRFKPVIQSELSGQKNRKEVVNLLTSLGYKPKVLHNWQLQDVDTSDLNQYHCDFYFIPV